LRYSKTVNGVTVTHIWDGQNIVAELSDEGVTALYLRGINLISATTAEGTKYYNYNAHGDVVQLVDSTGQLLWTYRYDAFGVEQEPSETDTNPFRYCAEYFDAETGTIYLRARYYDPVIGRFTTEDPARDGLNYYTYCVNSPVVLADFTGEAPQTLMADGGHSSQSQAQLARLAVQGYLAQYGTLDIFTVHDVLDVLGFIPVVGDVIDLGNGVYYLIEGDYTNAALSAIAIIPIAGDLVSKTGKTAIKVAGKADEVAALVKGVGKVDDVAALAKGTGKGFNTFDAFKKAMGSAGEGMEWHHIVEQSQIGKSGFAANQVHNVDNLIAIDKATHAKISGYYNSIQTNISGNMRVRDWLAGHSYQFQYQFGIDILKKYGVIK
jgi:RHS repeat-associated protein